MVVFSGRMVVSSGGGAKPSNYLMKGVSAKFTTEKQETLIHLLILTIAPILGICHIHGPLY